jgi:flavin reductase (DIM6/NTAB) family NADH-FMN oxidoreductase RutF
VHKSKHIFKIIQTSKVFAVNFLSFDNSDIVHKCNLLHGEHIDKFKELNLLKLNSTSMECPILKESCAYLECNVIDILEYKDYAVFIAKIINSNVKYACKRLYHLKDDKYTTTKD